MNIQRRNARVRFVQSLYLFFQNDDLNSVDNFDFELPAKWFETHNDSNEVTGAEIEFVKKLGDVDLLLSDAEELDTQNFDEAFFKDLVLKFKNNFFVILDLIKSSAPEFDFSKIPNLDKALIALGANEVYFFDTPTKVVIDESIEIGKLFKGHASNAFINGALFNIFASKNDLNDQERRIFAKAHELGFNFSNPKNLISAFVHKSILNEDQRYKDSYERLEFLGDSVCQTAVSKFLFDNQSDAPEGTLTKMRVNIVNTTPMSIQARAIGLTDLIIASNQTEITEGISADVFESFVGAVFLEFGQESATNFVKKYLIEPSLSAEGSPLVAVNFKSQFVESCQKIFKQPPQFSTVSETKQENGKPWFTVCVKFGKNMEYQFFGSAGRVQDAEVLASKEALTEIQKSLSVDKNASQNRS